MQGTKEQYSGRQNLIFSEYNSFKTRQNKIKLEQSKPEENLTTPKITDYMGKELDESN